MTDPNVSQSCSPQSMAAGSKGKRGRKAGSVVKNHDEKVENDKVPEKKDEKED